MSLFSRRNLIIGLLALVITIVHLIVLSSSVGRQVEPLSIDLWAQFGGSPLPTSDMMIVAMDEVSYGVLNIPLNQPWPRALHAKLLDKLAAAHARKVIFDVLFLGEGSDPTADRKLATSIKQIPTVLGTDSLVKDQASASGTFKLEEILRPYPSFATAAESLGLVTLPEDSGYVRRFQISRTAMTQDIPTLAEAAVDFGAKPKPSTRDLIKFYGGSGTVPTFSYYQLIDDQKPFPVEILRNKTVFVGLVLRTDIGPAQKDVFKTPFGRIFGTEIHATAALNLVSGTWVRRLSSPTELMFLGALTFILSVLLFSVRPQWGVIALVIAFFSWLIGGYLAYCSDIFLPGLILTSTILPLTFLSSTLYYYFVTRKAQLKMESAFQFYVSPQMASQIANDPNALGLGGEKVWATALFTDIEGFTSISESMPAEKVAAMLNAYFTEVMDVVFQNDGTLIKFIGDAVFVIWGAPLKMNDHAEKACRTALAIQREVARFNASGRFPALHTRIGINTGPMVVGNLGSAKRFDYTGIGDSVNLASRIEGINKYFGTKIMITDSVKKEVRGGFNTLRMGLVQAVGKNESESLYTLLEQAPAPALETKWDAALAHFAGRRWTEAEVELRACLVIAPELTSSINLYLAQIARFQGTAPDENWKGELIFGSK